MLWSDMITSGIKEKFQRDFGDGGRGLVLITNQPSRKVLLHKNLTDESQFTWKNLDHRQFVNPQIGFLGEVAIPNYPRVLMKHELMEQILDGQKLNFYFANTQAENSLTIKANFQSSKKKKISKLSEETKITQNQIRCLWSGSF